MNNQSIYYQKRADEYERVYEKPERQQDLASIKKYLNSRFKNLSIMEIACGTGYWTEILAMNTRSIVAVDINSKVLEIAETKSYPKNNVIFRQHDIEDLKAERNEFEGLFGGFIWSHILREDQERIFETILSPLRNDSDVILLDNKFVNGSSTPISRMDSRGNTFQQRQLQSKETFEIVKNFPDEREMKDLVGKRGKEFKWIDFEYYWMVQFKKV